MQNDSESFYRTLCSLETLRSSSKGFFRDFIESVVEEAGEVWIREIFGRLNNDLDRVKLVLTDPRVKDIVSETLNRVKYLYRTKDAVVSRNKRLEGFQNAARNHHEKALLLFSQAVLRSPATGKVPAVDEGFSLSLGLLARAETLMDLGNYDFALADLMLAFEEDCPQKEKTHLIEKLEECKRILEECNKAVTSPRGLSKSTYQLENQFKPPMPPSLKGGASRRQDLPGVSSLVDILETTIAGKHAVASGEISPGDILASEPALASCLLPEFYGTHCHHCLTRLRAPIGCPVCSSVAFCGKTCRDQSLSTYHKYECKILALLIGSGMSILSSLALRMVTQEGYGTCRQIWKKIMNETLQFTETNIGVDAKDNNDKGAEAAQNIKKHVGPSKSTKRRHRKKKLEENTLHYEKNYEKADTKKHEKILDVRAYALVTLADQRSPKDFFERTLMALFLLKALQKVEFFNITPKSDGTTNEEEMEIGALLLRNLQLLQFNAHEIYETRLAPNHRYRGNKTIYIGVAVYPSVARFNHECYPAVARCPTNGCDGLLAIPRKPGYMMECPSCQDTKNLQEPMKTLSECEKEYTRGLNFMEEEKTQEAIEIFVTALEKFHRIAVPPHRGTHLAEIAFAACMADSGNTWRPLQ
ncbi:SET and MYND domain-containing protein 4-like isoform X3 [Venturia canescens]|uniref:SET and MYND domain-containing protein 4-like isoform X3 n=1 Tax=Venturia canescens TaxID=32260 RepID=UPI001C9C3BF8|nr:SET and MYND domain-containing protein 4-like isoform X3 [Venturia canescens]